MSHNPYKPNNPLEMLKGFEGNRKAKEDAFHQVIMTECTCAAKDMPFGRCCRAPAWHDAPTLIGRWLCARPHGAMFTCIITNVEKSEKIGGVRWFGPIPEDKS